MRVITLLCVLSVDTFTNTIIWCSSPNVEPGRVESRWTPRCAALHYANDQ